MPDHSGKESTGPVEEAVSSNHSLRNVTAPPAVSRVPPLKGSDGSASVASAQDSITAEANPVTGVMSPNALLDRRTVPSLGPGQRHFQDTSLYYCRHVAEDCTDLVDAAHPSGEAYPASTPAALQGDAIPTSPLSPLEARVRDLQWQIHHWRSEVTRLRGEIRRQAGNTGATGGFRRLAVRRSDPEGPGWRGDFPGREPAPSRLRPPRELPSPGALNVQKHSRRSPEASLQRHLMQPEDNLLMWCHDGSGTPGLHPPAGTKNLPQVAQGRRSLSPLGETPQLHAAEGADPGPPPGLELPAALLVATCRGGGCAGGQVLTRPDDREGQRGGASLVTFAMEDPSLPGASSGSFGTGRVTEALQPRRERDRRINSFHTGPQFGLPALRSGSVGGTSRPLGTSAEAPTTLTPPFQTCGAAPASSPGVKLLRTPSPGESPQSRNARLEASGSWMSMAELNMVQLTMLVGEIPRLELGNSTANAEGLAQWLRNVEQSLEPAGTDVTSWWRWACNSAYASHRVFLATPLDQRETVRPQGEHHPSTR